MKNLRLYLSVSLVMSLVIFMGCTGNSSQKQEGGREITDMLQREVTIPDSVNRIIGIGPGALRLIVYLRATDRVVGVEEIERRAGRPYAYAHPEITEKPIIGPQFTGDAELIASQRPDVIFKTYTTKDEADVLQKKTGVPVVAIRYENTESNWNNLQDALTLMGSILRESARADSLVSFYSSSINALENRTSDIAKSQKPEIYLGGLSHRGTHGINSTSPHYEPFVYVNARNVASSLGNEHGTGEGVMVDNEQLIVWDPDKIFLDAAGMSIIRNDIRDHKAFLKQITAFQNDAIYRIHPYNWYSTNFATLLANAWYIGKVLHPGQFDDISAKEKANEIYSEMLGEKIYQKMSDFYGPYEQIPVENIFSE